MRDQIDLRTKKKEAIKIENQGEIWYKMIQHCKMINLSKKNRSSLGPIIFGTT